MECDICANHISGEPGLHCPACARSILYPLRVRYATVLLSKGAVGRKVEALVSEAKVRRNIGAGVSDEPKESDTLVYNAQSREALEIKRRIDRIMEQNDILRERIESHKKAVAMQKTAVIQRQQDLVKSKEQLRTAKATSLEPLQKTIKSLKVRQSKTHKHTVTARGYICKQAAILANLQQSNAVADDGSSTRSIHTIAGLSLIDLRDLNHVNPKELSGSISSAVHLVSNVCHYLGIRLPAELVLPSSEWPFATIFSLSSSYLALSDQERTAIFQRMYNFPSPSASRHLSASRHSEGKSGAALRKNLPRPRPLYFDKKLIQIARDDPALYSLQVEGLALFAWDIAWLCRTQGVVVAQENWADICAVGQNLWSLLMIASSRNHSTEQNVPSSLPLMGDAVQRSASALNTLQAISNNSIRIEPKFGFLSHATSHSFLRSALTTPSYSNVIHSPTPSIPVANNDEFGTSAWKYASPTRFIEKLKATLLNDISGLEWELLDGETGSPEGDKTGSRALGGVGDGPGSTNGVEPGREERPAVAGSGWTKLKSRSAPGVQ